MTFHHSAQNIRIEDGHILKAELLNVEQEWIESEIDLNDHIGNENGSFFWGGGDFSGSADDVRFEIEGEADVPVLRATLKNENDEDVDCNINLAERIENHDGRFVFTG